MAPENAISHPILSSIFVGSCHGNVSIRSVVSSILEEELGRQWSLIDMSCALRFSEGSQYLGGVNLQGLAQFKTECLPPEMFVKLSPAQLKRYRKYWSSVENRFGVTIEKAIIEPVVDVATGETFVVKCHFMPLMTTDKSNDLLPYQLVPASPCADIWALGQLLFLLCTGQTVFQVAPRDGRLVRYGEICDWDAAPVIFEHVSDPLAQDVLLMLLSPYEVRRQVTIESVLSHPFFNSSSNTAAETNKIKEKRKVATAAHRRLLDTKMHDESEKKWLEKRSTTIQCWDFALLERIYLSPSSMAHCLTARKVSSRLPCSFVLLPFNLSETIPSVETVEITERLGMEMLQLSKVCYFTSVVKQVTSASGSTATPRKWSSSELLQAMDLSSLEFGVIQSEMAGMAAKHVEAFRHDPMAVALKMVQNRLNNVLACFEDRTVFLYFVDEFACSPVTNQCSPLRLNDEWRDKVLISGVLFMHLCSLYVRGVSKSLSGFAKLLYQTDDVAVPASWESAASGLLHELNEGAFICEIKLLQEALSEMYPSHHRMGDDDLDVLRDFLSDVDPQSHWGGLQMVLVAEACIWTTTDGSSKLKELSKSITFQDVLRQRRETEEMLSRGSMRR